MVCGSVQGCVNDIVVGKVWVGSVALWFFMVYVCVTDFVW